MRALWLPAVLAAACQPDPALQGRWPCGLRPDAGVVVRPVLCADDLPPGGEGTIGDLWLASPHLRAIVRATGGARTRAGIGAGTLIDLATWDDADLIHELIPLIEDQWLDAVRIEIEPDGLVVDGRGAALPDLAPSGAGGGRVRWSLDPERPRLLIDGVERLWLHPRGGASLSDLGLLRGSSAIALDADVEDRGGVLLIAADVLWVGASTDLVSRQHPDGIHVTGAAPDATALEWFDADGTSDSVRVAGTWFDLRLPPTAERVRAIAAGRAPSPVFPVGRDLLLELGPRGEVVLDVAWVGRPQATVLRWSGGAGSGSSFVDGERVVVPTGPGPATLEVDGQQIERVVPVNGAASGSVTLNGDRGARLRVLPDWPGDRDSSIRRSNRASALRASLAGANAIVLTARFDVAVDSTPALGFPTVLPGASGRTADGSDVIAWPWTASPRTSAGGFPPIHQMTTPDAVAALGADRRRVAVPLAALVDFEPWATAWPRPTHVILSAPSESPEASWAPWLNAIADGAPIYPLGPTLWIDDRGELLMPPTAIDRELARGALTAGDGPDLDLRVAGVGPGDQVPETRRPGPGVAWVAEVLVHDPDGASRLTLLTDRGTAGTWSIDEAPSLATIPPAARVVVATLWTPGGGPWATTGPIWLHDPARPKAAP